MHGIDMRSELSRMPRPLVVALAGLAAAGVAAAFTVPALLALLAVPAGATALFAARSRGEAGLQVQQMERLRQAEVALASAASTEAAARELAEHARALLGATHATVLIEGIGDTVRVTLGDSAGSVYGDGSRMRLLDDAGVPCGSIAVSARADGRPYTDQQERMLDALAQRVSSTLHRLSLWDEVQSERRVLSDVLESSSDGIFSVGLDLAVRSWNPAIARILGVPATAAVGQAVTSVFRPVDQEGLPRYGPNDPGRSGRAEAAVVAVTGADGELRWLTCTWSPLSEGGYVVVARDETERQRLQDDKDGWVAQVSHELRTPLTPIKGFLHTLQRRDDQFTGEDRQRIYEVMLREEQRLEDLVSSLLEATTADRGELPVNPEVLQWPALVEAQVERHRRRDPSRTVSLSVSGPAVVVADRHLAETVIRALLSNAVKYAAGGSSIEVEVEGDGTDVCTSVTDDGPGVPLADRERIFEKLTRLGDHRTRPEPGVGLGLYLARRAVEAMGGQIWCEAAPGGGARFTFTLPAGRAQARAAMVQALQGLDP